MNKLLNDLTKFSEQLHMQQKYLERTKGMHKPNYEMEASSAEILAGVVKLLDELIARHMIHEAGLNTTPYFLDMSLRELKRQSSRWSFSHD